MPPDVLLLVCDTARADAFRPWGAPHESPTMQALCERGTMYRNAFAPAPWTVPTHASLFTGALPTEHGITGDCFQWHDGKPTSPAEAVRAHPGPWLAETMRERGYRTWGTSSNTWIGAWGGFDRGFDSFLDIRPWARPKGLRQALAVRARRMLGALDRGGAEAAERFGREVAGAGPQPLFAFVNLMEVHAPYNPPRPFYPFPPWRRLRTTRISGGPDQGLSYNAGVVPPPPGYVDTIRALYRGSARYEDLILGRFVRAVRERDRPAIVMVVADHGENLGERGEFNHNSSLSDHLLHVPLVVWGHRVDVAAGAVEEPVSLLGIAAWARAVAEDRVDLPAPDGAVVSEYESTIRHNGVPEEIRRMTDDRGGRRARPLIYHPGLAVHRGRHKYVAVANGDESLYDLGDDPGEERDLASARPDLLDDFRPFRAAWEERRTRRPDYAAGDVAEGEIAEHLRELGYIE
ncbi:MAG TPA: sulfatase-like hydrolase/transferase [Actinomycetota bacterium]|jgi:choline-sulfatase